MNEISPETSQKRNKFRHHAEKLWLAAGTNDTGILSGTSVEPDTMIRGPTKRSVGSLFTKKFSVKGPTIGDEY